MVIMSRIKKEGFLSRWSRRKRESATGNGDVSGAALSVNDEATAHRSVEAVDQAGNKSEGEAPLQLPPLDELGPDSDFQAFMDPRVDEAVRRAALKTLFRDPAFNVTDGLDVYAEDYTKLEKLTPAMVAALRYAQRSLFGEQEQAEQASAVHVDAESGETNSSQTHSGESVAGTDSKEDEQIRDMAVHSNGERPAQREAGGMPTEPDSERSGARKS